MSDTIKYYDDITDRAISLLLQQFKTKENCIKFVEILTKETQDLEYIFEQINELTWLDSSSGLQLDRLGEIIGYDRDSRNDEDYRNYLKFGVLLNKSAGEPEILITALKLLTESTKVSFYELFPAACFAHIDGQTGLENLTTKMDDLSLGGVKFAYISQVVGIPFSFGSELSEESGLGFAWIDGGGQPVTENAGKFAWTLPN